MAKLKPKTKASIPAQRPLWFFYLWPRVLVKRRKDFLKWYEDGNVPPKHIIDKIKQSSELRDTIRNKPWNFKDPKDPSAAERKQADGLDDQIMEWIILEFPNAVQ